MRRPVDADRAGDNRDRRRSRGRSDQESCTTSMRRHGDRRPLDRSRRRALKARPSAPPPASARRVRNSHSARCNSSENDSSCWRSQQSSAQQCRTRDEIGQRRGVGCGGLGALAGDQIELGQLLALLSRGDQRRAAVELIDDVEDRLLPLLGEACRAASSLPIRRCASVALLLRDQTSRRLPERGRGRTGRSLPGARPTPDGRPPTEPRGPVLGRSPRTSESVVISAMFPRQASCCNAFCVSSGRRVSLPTIRSTTLSVYPLA